MRSHRNNIGCLRLLFASLVILGHAPEQVDGDRSRELLTTVFHTLSLGEFAVDAFFVISGYLITKSMVQSSGLRDFLERRVLRIYPAYAVAFLVAVFGVGALVGADPLYHVTGVPVRIALLRVPDNYPGALVGLHYPVLNAAMWTIRYEFECYLLTAALGVLGLLRRRKIVLGATIALAGALVISTFAAPGAALNALGDHQLLYATVGKAAFVLRFASIFMIGACAALYRAELDAFLTPRKALAGLLVAAALMFNPHVAEVGLVVFGGLALYWLAFHTDLGRIQRINDRWDISYGVYLYGWPVATTILWYNPGISPWLLALVSFPLACIAGTLSWFGVERWTKDLARARPAAQPASARTGLGGSAVGPS